MLRLWRSELKLSFCSSPKECNENSANKYLLNASFVHGSSLDAGAVSMESTSSCPHGAYMLRGDGKTDR